MQKYEGDERTHLLYVWGAPQIINRLYYILFVELYPGRLRNGMAAATRTLDITTRVTLNQKKIYIYKQRLLRSAN